MKIKTAELTGAALDWAVGIAEGFKTDPEDVGALWRPDGGVCSVSRLGAENGWGYRPSTNWSEGGPIIGREKISFTELSRRETDGRITTAWEASLRPVMQFQNYSSRMTCYVGKGETHLIAAMRAFVASKLGDEVDVPEELLP